MAEAVKPQPQICCSFLAIDCRWLKTAENSIVQLFDPALFRLLQRCLGVEGGGGGVGRMPGSELALKLEKPCSYDHIFSGYNSSTTPPLQKLGWDRLSKHPIDIHNGGLYKYIIFFVWYFSFLNLFEIKCYFVFCTC